MANRTDLAVESFEKSENTKIDGVKITEKGNLTYLQVLNQNGADSIGKPIGNYCTLKVKSFINDIDILDGRLNEFSYVLSSLLPKKLDSILVIGLGNDKITADALGPSASDFVLSTRHITGDLAKNLGMTDLFPVSCVNTGVLGNTGIESAEIVKGIVTQIHPSCVITVDALAAMSTDRLGTTVQFSDSGISPGSGVGNHRYEISEHTLGIPVISIGIPTVVSTSVFENEGEPLFVTPREIDKITNLGAKLIGMGINVCLQKNLSVEDLLTLVG